MNGWYHPISTLTPGPLGWQTPPAQNQAGSVGFGWKPSMSQQQAQPQHSRNNQPTKAQMIAKIEEHENAILRMNAEITALYSLLSPRMDTT
jgi:hypothetical protein